jgi:hypothetical protein
VIKCEPIASVELLNLAFPLLTLPVPSVVLPSLNVTVPVVVVEETVAVNVTEEPKVDGFEDDDNVMVVLALFTVCVTEDEALALQFESPAYDPVTECDPAVRVDVLKVAFPLLRVPVPRVVLPSLNVTVPAQVDGVTVAVNLTEEP